MGAKSYHINAKGEPGVCRALGSAATHSRGCPFGDSDHHFPTPEAAREAYEARQTGAFARTLNKKFTDPGKLSRKERIELARTSSDENVLMAIAGKTHGMTNRKVLAGLAANPHVTTAVLVEARANAGLPVYIEAAALECHDNYPAFAVTGCGATQLKDRGMNNRIKELMETEGASYDLLYFCSIHPEENYGVKKALANPANKFDSKLLGRTVINNPQWLRAAVEGNHFPSLRDISGRHNDYYYNSPGAGYHMGKVPDDVLLESARYTPDNEKAEALFKRFGVTLRGEELAVNLFANPNISPELKDKARGLLENKIAAHTALLEKHSKESA